MATETRGDGESSQKSRRPKSESAWTLVTVTAVQVAVAKKSGCCSAEGSQSVVVFQKGGRSKLEADAQLLAHPGAPNSSVAGAVA